MAERGRKKCCCWSDQSPPSDIFLVLPYVHGIPKCLPFYQPSTNLSDISSDSPFVKCGNTR
jgi:hypothetical protein